MKKVQGARRAGGVDCKNNTIFLEHPVCTLNKEMTERVVTIDKRKEKHYVEAALSRPILAFFVVLRAFN